MKNIATNGINSIATAANLKWAEVEKLDEVISIIAKIRIKHVIKN